MKKRGAYFFVLDALIGGAIFLVSVVMILNSYLNTPDTKQTYMIAENVMNLMLTTKVIDYRDPYITELYNRGLITNKEQSLFEQIAELHYKGYVNETQNLSRNIVNTLVPEQYGASLSYINLSNDEETQFYVNTTEYERINNSRFMVSSRKIIFYSLNQSQYFGPDIMELKVWI